jgi:Cu(I)/Ag(I) efflux system membrane fusion protein
MVREGRDRDAGHAADAPAKHGNACGPKGQVPESQAAQLQPGIVGQRDQPGGAGADLRGPVAGDSCPRSTRPRARARRRLELANVGGPARAGHVRRDAVCRTGPAEAGAGAQRRGDPHRAPQRGDAGRRRWALPAGGGAYRASRLAVRPKSLQGLQAGQRVVLSGQFLIDSEASLRGLEARLNRARCGCSAAAAPWICTAPMPRSKRSMATR